jgi:ribonuclease P protein component
MERLKRRTEFRAAATGAKASARGFVLQARRRDDNNDAVSPPRVGFIVSRQVGNAVERNRVRRRLREIVRLAPAAELAGGHDYVLIGRRATLAVPFSDLRRDFEEALRRVHLTGRGDGKSGARQPAPLHKVRSSDPRPS